MDTSAARTISERKWQALGGEDAGDSSEVVGDAKIGPMGRVEKGLNGGEAVVAKLEDQQAAGFQMASCLGNEGAVEFVAFFTSEESGRGLVVADFPRKRFGVALADIGRIADDEIEGQWRVASGEWREPLQQI